jgi:hypothetical protein
MKKKDVDIWWNVVHDVVEKDIGKVYKMYEGNEKF